MAKYSGQEKEKRGKSPSRAPAAVIPLTILQPDRNWRHLTSAVPGSALRSCLLELQAGLLPTACRFNPDPDRGLPPPEADKLYHHIFLTLLEKKRKKRKKSHI